MFVQKVLPKLLAIVLSGLVLMFLFPFLITTVVHSDAAFGLIFLGFFALNPLFALFTGISAGKNLRLLWYAPAVPAGLFLLSAWLLFEPGEPAFLYYAAGYLIIGTASMLVTALALKLSNNRRSSGGPENDGEK